MKTQWTCLLGFGPGEPQMKNELSVVQNKGQTILLGTQPKRCFYFLFTRVSKPWSSYTRPSYTQEDAEKMAASVADVPISESMVFGELWKKKYRGALCDIEEGVLRHWHYGRTVLVGDTAHKVRNTVQTEPVGLCIGPNTNELFQITPNIALGGNSGMESVVVLTNLLNRTLKEHQGGRLSRATINAVFHEYQEIRLPRMRHIMNFSSLVSRTQGWDNWLLKATSIYIMPYLPQRKLANDLGEIIRKAPSLDFVPLGPWNKGLLEWEDVQKSQLVGKTGQKTLTVGRAQMSLLGGGLLAISWLLWALNSKQIWSLRV